MAIYIPVVLPNYSVGSQGQLKVPVGHAGVIVVTDAGVATYYEWGRYAPGGANVITNNSTVDGNLRRITLGTLSPGSNGELDLLSMKSALDQISTTLYPNVDVGEIFASQYQISDVQAGQINTNISNGSFGTYGVFTNSCFIFVQDQAANLGLNVAADSWVRAAPGAAPDAIMQQNNSGFIYFGPNSWYGQRIVKVDSYSDFLSETAAHGPLFDFIVQSTKALFGDLSHIAEYVVQLLGTLVGSDDPQGRTYQIHGSDNGNVTVDVVWDYDADVRIATIIPANGQAKALITDHGGTAISFVSAAVEAIDRGTSGLTSLVLRANGGGARRSIVLNEATGDATIHIGDAESIVIPVGSLISVAGTSTIDVELSFGSQWSLQVNSNGSGSVFRDAIRVTSFDAGSNVIASTNAIDITSAKGADNIVKSTHIDTTTPNASPVKVDLYQTSSGTLIPVDPSHQYGQQFGSNNGGVAATQAANALLNQILSAMQNGSINNVAALAGQVAASLDYQFDAADFAMLGSGGTVMIGSVIGTLQVRFDNPLTAGNGNVSGNFLVMNSSGNLLTQFDMVLHPASVLPGGSSGYFLDTTSSIFAPLPTAPVDNSILNNIYSPTGSSNASGSNPGAGWLNGIHTDFGSYQIAMNPGILNDPSDNFFTWVPSSIAGDGYSPGRDSISQRDPLFGGLSWLYTNGSQSTNPWGLPLSVFDLANQSYQNVDPLVIDLNGDGVVIQPFDAGDVRFDVDADGYLEHTSWISKDDGLLVRDWNNDGTISDMTEIVSDYFNGRTPDGKAAIEILAAYDSNNDGVFSAADAQFSNFRIWRDANGNGLTDSGELLTLTQAGITAFNLAHTPTNGLVVGGADVLAKSTAVFSGGRTGEVLSINLIANPYGSLVEALGSDYKAFFESFEGGSDVAALISGGGSLNVNLGTANPNGYTHVFGSDGDDTIIGDGQDNWIVGGRGRDILKGGAGNDFIIVDSQDDFSQLDGGAGFDVVQAVGSGGITLNLARANIEAAVGSSGSDILVGGGYSNVFIDGGAGDDFIYGGAADDALSGGDGDDVIEGMSGDDLIRGHRGEDLLRGGDGNDLLFGGEGNDVLLGSDGNDLLEGGQGDDALDGGNGTDTANFTGKFADYTFVKDGTDWIVRDRRANGDGVDRLTNMEVLSFSDLKNISLSQESPLLVNDIVNGVGLAPITITKAQILGNDVDLQGDALTITGVLNAIGGTVALNAQGDVVFTPTAGYFGVRSFQYKAQDSKGNAGAMLTYSTTGEQAEMKGVVRLRDPSDPLDPLFYDQWYLSDSNVLPVWKDYTGYGVNVGIVETGVMNFNHPDLAPNVSSQFLENYPTPESSITKHGTLVAGVIAAARNDTGSVGVAYNAKLSSFSLDGPYPEVTFSQFDVVNNSWTFPNNRFASDFVAYPSSGQIFIEGAAYGRNGLGTAMVFASGNNRAAGDNANYQNIANNRFSIAVGAINAGADLGTLVIGQAPFSNPGANILVAAPGSNIVSTSNLIENSNGSTFGDDYDVSQGTSFAAPIVSGIVALMLEANPHLGYRDIQKILAYSARQLDTAGNAWSTNGAFNWNGGGLHVSHDYGFGSVDALAAVRLAETWTEQQTYYNEHSEALLNEPGDGIPVPIQDGGGLSWTTNVNFGDWYSLEHVQVRVELNHANLGDLVIKLTSPDGTQSILLDRPGVSTTNLNGDGATSLNFTFGSTHYWGEQITGTWTLTVTDANLNGATGVVKNWELQFFGEDTNFNDTYIYTNEFGALGVGARATLTSNGGFDTINAATISSNSVINLTPGSISTLAGRQLTIGNPSTVYNAFAGDGDDQLIGSDADNALYGGRGNDALNGGNGRDILSGDFGNDIMTGGAGQDMFVVKRRAGDQDTIVDFKTGGIEKVALVGFGAGFSFTSLTVTQVGADTLVAFGDGQSLTLKNFSASQFVANDILTSDDFRFLSQVIGTAGAETYVWGGDNDWLALGEGGNDSLFGGTGNDTLFGGSGQDLLAGGIGNNVLAGGVDADLFVVASNPGKLDTITDFNVGERDRIAIVGISGVLSFADLVKTQVGTDTVIGLGSGQALTIKNTMASVLTADNFVFLTSFPYANQVTGTAGVEAFQWAGPGGLIAFGEGGDDTIIGYTFADAIYGGDGNDRLFGRGGDDQLYGGNGNDLLNGDTGNDILSGGAGADVFAITKQAGATTIIMDWKTGGGRDKLVFELFSSPMSLTPAQQGADTVLQLANNQKVVLKNTLVSSVTNDDIVLVDTWQISAQFSGTDLAETYVAPDDANYVMWGYGGNDQIYGGYGIDQIYGGDGDDVIVGEPENTSGAGGGDVLYGGAGNDQIFGGGGADVIRGDAGNDYIQGDQGNDILIGGTGYDRLYGGGGNDTLILENEDDDFYGQAGSDKFVVLNNPGFQIGSGLKNLIFDFDATASGDKIDLSGIAAATSMAAVEQVRFTYQGSNFSRVYVAGINSDQYVTLYHGTSTGPTLTAANFIFSSGAMSFAVMPEGSGSAAGDAGAASNAFLLSVVPELSQANQIGLPDGFQYAGTPREIGEISITGREGVAFASPGEIEVASVANRLIDAMAVLGAQPYGETEAAAAWMNRTLQPGGGVLAPAAI